MELTEEIFITSLLLQTDEDLLGLVGFIDERLRFKAKITSLMGSFKPPNEANAAFQYLKDTKQGYYLYYVFAHLTIDNLMGIIHPKNNIFNERLFIECNHFKKQSVNKVIKHLDNAFRLILLKIHYPLITE